jgi:hypothetical protein
MLIRWRPSALHLDWIEFPKEVEGGGSICNYRLTLLGDCLSSLCPCLAWATGYLLLFRLVGSDSTVNLTHKHSWHKFLIWEAKATRVKWRETIITTQSTPQLDIQSLSQLSSWRPVMLEWLKCLDVSYVFSFPSLASLIPKNTSRSRFSGWSCPS